MGRKLYLSLKVLLLVFAIGTAVVCVVALGHDHLALPELRDAKIDPDLHSKVIVFMERGKQHLLPIAQVGDNLRSGSWWAYGRPPDVNVIDPNGWTTSIPFTPDQVSKAIAAGYRLQTAFDAMEVTRQDRIRKALWLDRSFVDGDSWFVMYLIALAAFVPLGILESLRRWVQWLKA